jgi:hypothetical protein
MSQSKKKIEDSRESLARAKLLKLESEDKWVFHGSPHKIEVFEPRQAYQYPKSKEEKIADGKPVVFASPSADIAIFMSIINVVNAPLGLQSWFGTDGEGKIKFKATKETIDQLHNSKGYVYIFDKTKFIPGSPLESLSYETVSPNDVTIVSEKDLPKNIEIRNF